MISLKKKLYILYQRFKTIDWKKGSGTVMYYIAIMWLIALSTILFAEYFHANSSVGKTQMYTDLLSDGSAFAGNNGWGLDEKEANKTYKKLISLNKKNFKDCSLQKLTFTNTDSKGNVVSYDKTLTGEKYKNNTTNVSTKLKTKTLTTKKSLNKTKKASTRITYSGGLKIVKEAYKHTYQYNPASQTHYVWGGGHGIPNDSLSWTQQADCSGFVSGVFRKCGYFIDSGACTGNMDGMGTKVGEGSYDDALRNAHPGDIILFWEAGMDASSHVAIYAGKKNGTDYMIHCSGGRRFTDWFNPGSGPGDGAIISTVKYLQGSYPKIVVRRIVDTTSTVAELPDSILDRYGLDDNQKAIFRALSVNGYSKENIAGIMGNLQQEATTGLSLTDPNCVQGHEGNTAYILNYKRRIENHEMSLIEFLGRPGEAYGIVQWDNSSDDAGENGRKGRLWKWAQNRQTTVSDIYAQVTYMIYEMQVTESGFFSDSIFRSIKDPVAAAQYFSDKFERCKIPGSRLTYASQWYSKIKNINIDY